MGRKRALFMEIRLSCIVFPPLSPLPPLLPPKRLMLRNAEEAEERRGGGGGGSRLESNLPRLRCSSNSGPVPPSLCRMRRPSTSPFFTRAQPNGTRKRQFSFPFSSSAWGRTGKLVEGERRWPLLCDPRQRGHHSALEARYNERRKTKKGRDTCR